MKLSDYANKVGVTYKTVYRWFKVGKLRGYQMDAVCGSSADCCVPVDGHLINAGTVRTIACAK